MDNRYYGTVIGEMTGFFEEQGFKANEDAFVNEKYSVKVEYDEIRQVYNLKMAEVSENGAGEYALITSYLFEDGQTERDAESVGIDFVDTLKKQLGIKATRKNYTVELPSANKGDSITVTTLTSKLLAIYPTLKDTYKAEVDAKGKYLYLDFMCTYFVPEIRRTLESGNKKTVKKLVDMLIEMFVGGDNPTSTMVVVLLAAAIGKNEERFNAATAHMDECIHLVTAVNNMIPLLGKDKKLTTAVKYQD